MLVAKTLTFGDVGVKPNKSRRTEKYVPTVVFRSGGKRLKYRHRRLSMFTEREAEDHTRRMIEQIAEHEETTISQLTTESLLVFFQQTDQWEFVEAT